MLFDFRNFISKVCEQVCKLLSPVTFQLIVVVLFLFVRDVKRLSILTLSVHSLLQNCRSARLYRLRGILRWAHGVVMKVDAVAVGENMGISWLMCRHADCWLWMEGEFLLLF